MNAWSTLLPDYPLAALFEALDGLTEPEQRSFLDVLAGHLATIATPGQWEAALEHADEVARQAS